MAYLISTMEPQRGFHPTSTSTIRLPIPPPNSLTSNSNENPYESCTLHLYFALPALVFVDTHELAQRTGQYGFAYWGGRDLEKPVHALPPPGDDKEAYSEVLVNVELDDDEGSWDLLDGETVKIEVPLHLRYGTPRSTRSRNGQGQGQEERWYEKIEVDWPTAFLLCPSSSSSSMLRPPQTSSQPRPLPAHVLAALPSSRKKQAHDQILISIPPHPNSTHSASSTLYLPVGDTSDLAFVEPLTALTILLCFVWLLRASCRTASRLSGREGGDNRKEE